VKPIRVYSQVEIEYLIHTEGDVGTTISICDLGHEGPSFHEATRYLKLFFDDIEFEVPVFGLGGPAELATEEQVREAIEFDQRHPVTNVHCYMGTSRSPAVALILMCSRSGPGKEDDAARSLFEQNSRFKPNEHVLKLGDRILGRDGAILQASRAAVGRVLRR
jgi:predicted protein tyrosine phosphatase